MTKTIMTAVSIAWILNCAIGCSSNCDEVVDLRVRYVSHSLVSEYPDLSMALQYDSRSGIHKVVPASLQTEAHGFGLSTTFYTPKDATFYGVLPDLSDSWQAQSLVSDYSLDSLWIRPFVHYGHHASKRAVVHFKVSELGPLGLPAIAPKPERQWVRIMSVYCIYDVPSKSLIFVDSANAPGSGFGGKYYGWNAAIDYKGEYFYYRKNNHAFRFCIATGSLDTLPAGPDPVIPSNADAVLIYNPDQARLYQLDSNLSVVRSMEAQLGTPMEICAASDDIFIVGAALPPDLSHYSPYMRVFVVDFQTGCVTRLFDTDRGDILGAEIL